MSSEGKTVIGVWVSWSWFYLYPVHVFWNCYLWPVSPFYRTSKPIKELSTVALSPPFYEWY